MDKKSMATGIWNSIKKTGAKMSSMADSMPGGGNMSKSMDRMKAEKGAWGEMFNKDIQEGRSGLSQRMGTKSASASTTAESNRISDMAPTMANAAINSFTSSGAMKAGLIGGGVGAIYGAGSDDTGILGGAIKGAAMGASAKGLFGIAGEQRTLAGMAKAELKM